MKYKVLSNRYLGKVNGFIFYDVVVNEEDLFEIELREEDLENINNNNRRGETL